ncbi:IL3B2 protein, partial [Piaya cayana]|nr:IL3B2 protein [Piaya cayana]
MLDSSTEYRGKMRARVNTPLDYEGPWSEWSEEFTWKTENVLPPVVLPVMLPAVIIALLIVVHCSYKYLLRKKQIWEEKIPNPSKSLLIQSYWGCTPFKASPVICRYHLGDLLVRELLKEAKIPVLFHLNRMTESPAEFHGTEAKTAQVSHASQTSSQTAGVPHKTSHSLSTFACPSIPMAGPSCLFARLPCKSTAHPSIASQTCFAFNGPYLYNSMMSSHPDMHHTLAADRVGTSEKSVSLQYVNLPKEDCPQASQTQEQTGADPPQPFLLPDEEHLMQNLNNEKKVSLAPPAYGKGMKVRTEKQKSPTALSCPLEYITTESLLLTSASDSTFLPLLTAGGLPCDSQEP